jgi:hypothetical protein
MILSSLLLYLIGNRRQVNAISLWVGAPLIRGLNWFVEFLAEEFSVFDQQFIIDRIEISLAFLASYFLLAAILVYSKNSSSNQAIRIIIPVSIVSVLFMFTFPKIAIEEIEEYIFEIGALETEPLRFVYGFLVPFITFTILVNMVARSTDEQSPSKTVYGITALLFLFSIFEGFDYDHDLYQLARSVILFSIVFLPLLVIVTSKIKLERIILVDKIGLPLFAYSFDKMKAEITDREMLTSGFITALLGLSEEISEEQTSLAVESGNLFYSIEKTSNGLCMLQSNAVNTILEGAFLEFVEEISVRLGQINDRDDINNEEFSNIVKDKFRFFLEV